MKCDETIRHSVRRCHRHSRRGSTFLLVIVLLAVVVLFCTAITTSVLSTNNTSFQNVNAQQAYFTARSAAQAVASYITNPVNASKLSSILPANGKTTSSSPVGIPSSMGTSCSVTISSNSDGSQLTIKATSKYQNASGSATLVLPKSGSGNQSTGGGNNTKAFGYLLFSEQDLQLQNSPILTGGSIFAFNSINLNGILTGIKNIMSFSNDITVSPNSTSTVGEIHSRTNVNLGSKQLTVSGDVTAGNSINNIGPSVISGTATANATYSITSASTVTNAFHAITESYLGSSYGFSTTYEHQFAPITNNVISTSGLIDPSTINQKNLTIDTSNNNVWLVVNGMNGVTWTGVHFNVTGSNKLYLYMVGNQDLTLNSCTIKMSSSAAANNIYLFSSDSGKETLTLGSQSEFDGCIYLLSNNASVSLSGNATVVGSVAAAQSISAAAGATFVYNASDVTGTPLEPIFSAAPAIFSSGSSGSSGSSSTTTWSSGIWKNS